MAARMGKARLKANQSIVIKAREYEKAKHGPVLCYDCRCPVRGVPRTTPTRHGKQVNVPAYFGLPAKAEAKGRGHKADCRYNIKADLEILVAESQELKNLDPDSESVIRSLNNGRVEFRLHILMKTLYESSVYRWDDSDDDNGGKPRIGTRYKKSGRVLNPYPKDR